MSDQNQTGSTQKKYREHTGWVYTVSWLHDQRLASAGRDKAIRAWNASGEDVPSILGEHKKRINSVSCSPKGQYIASASEDKTVRIFRVSGSREVYCLEDHHRPVNCVAWSPKLAPNGDLLLASGGDDAVVRIWQVLPDENGKLPSEKVTFRNHAHAQVRRLKRWINGTGINALAWSADGQLIASAGDDKKVRIWKADTSEEVRCYEGHRRRINALTWSADGALIASAGDDQCVHIWQVATGRLVQTIQPDQQPNFIQRAIARFRSMRKPHSTRTTRLLSAPMPLSFGIVTALAWSPSLKDQQPEDQKLAFASQKVVHIFERGQIERSQEGVTPTCTYTYQQHTDWVRTVAWSPDGTRIASAGDDREVHVWNGASPPRIPDRYTTSVDNP
jgi:WD40 repeat protein